MNEVEPRIREHLQVGRMMQLATVCGDQPWCCTVYFVADEDLNLYWISSPERRHSQELHQHEKIAAAIPIKYTPGEQVIGIQVEGGGHLVENPTEIKEAIRLYADRYQRGEDWYNDFIAGKNNHKLYRLKPRLFVLFDEVAFPNDPRKEWVL